MSIIPGEAPPLVDTGNSLLVSGMPASLQTGLIQAGAGQAGVATIRTPDVTLTISLTRDQANEWSRMLAQLRDSLSGSGLIAAGPGVAAVPRP